MQCWSIYLGADVRHRVNRQNLNMSETICKTINAFGLCDYWFTKGPLCSGYSTKQTFNKVWAKCKSENSFQKTCGGTCYLWLIAEKDLGVLIIILKARFIIRTTINAISIIISIIIPTITITIITWKLAPFGLNRNCVNFSLKKLSFLITVSKLASVFLNLFT